MKVTIKWVEGLQFNAAEERLELADTLVDVKALMVIRQHVLQSVCIIK